MPIFALGLAIGAFITRTIKRWTKNTSPNPYPKLSTKTTQSEQQQQQQNSIPSLSQSSAQSTRRSTTWVRTKKVALLVAGSTAFAGIMLFCPAVREALRGLTLERVKEIRTIALVSVYNLPKTGYRGYCFLFGASFLIFVMAVMSSI